MQDTQNAPSLFWKKYNYKSFQVYNHTPNYERLYLNQKDLALMLHKNVFQFIEKIQSKAVLYTDIIFSATEAKEWDAEGNASLLIFFFF